MDDNERLALAVGRVVVRAAQLEGLLAMLVFECLRSTHKDRSKISGQSGTQLARLLTKASQEDLSSKYSELAERRNSVVHGLWSGGSARLLSERYMRGASSVGDLTQVEWSFDELDGLAQELKSTADLATKRLFSLVGLPENGDSVVGRSHDG